MQYCTIENGNWVCNSSEVKFDSEYDLIVVGTGTAGAMAAICAGREGSAVLAVETATAPGGVGVVSGVWPYYYGIHAGLQNEINQTALNLEKLCNYAEYNNQIIERNICVPSAPKCIALEQELKKANCTLWTETTVTGVYRENDRIIGVELLNNGKIINVSCGAIIDSADGFLSKLAGCEIVVGRESDHKAMSFSKFIGLAQGNKVRTTCTFCGYIDEDNPEKYSECILKAGAKEPCLYDEYDEDKIAIFEGGIVGKREVCSVKTKNVYSAEDFFAGKFSKHPVYYTFAPFDNSNTDIENENDAVLMWRALIHAVSYGLSIGVDMDNLISKEYENLFLAGKHIGVGRDLIACTRMKADIEKSGEAAALIATVYLKNGSVSYDELLPYLKKHKISDCLYPSGYAHINRMKEDGTFEPFDMDFSNDELKEILSGDNPEKAYLYILRNSGNQKLQTNLIGWTKSNSTVLKENSAIALGIIGKRDGIEILRGLLKKPAYILFTREFEPCYYPWLTDTDHCNALKALYLLYRFCDKESISLVQAIIDDNAEHILSCITSDEKERYRRQFIGIGRKFLNHVKEC